MCCWFALVPKTLTASFHVLVANRTTWKSLYWLTWEIQGSKAAPAAGAVSAVQWRKDKSGQNNDFTDSRRRKGLTEVHSIKNINSYLDISILHCNMPDLAEK